MKRTEQQDRILKELLTLKETHGKNLKIEIEKRDNCREVMSQNSSARIGSSCGGGRNVFLELVEPENDNNLDEWADAISRVNPLFDKISEEIAHENNHPDFITALKNNLYNKL